MIKYFALTFCILIGVNGFAWNDIEYQNKRLLNNLKKNGISDFSILKELHSEAWNQSKGYGKFFKVQESVEESKVQYVFIGRVNSCRTGGCDEGALDSNSVESEYFDYFIFFDSSKTVSLIEVFNYQATHGYEVTAKGWLKQFVGFSGNDTLIVNKDIDGISGATISVHAITLDVQEKTRILKSID